MRIWDEHGRIGGWIHPLDLAIIILLLVIGYRLAIPYLSGPIRSRPRNVTAGLVVKNIPPYLAGSIRLGDKLFRDGSEGYLGRFTGKKAFPAELILERDDKVILVQAPRNLDLHLELRGQAQVATGSGSTGVFLGKRTIRVGDVIRVHTLYAAFAAEVESLKLTP